jgi:hypothetical protein
LVSSGWDMSKLVMKGEALSNLSSDVAVADEKRVQMALAQFLKFSPPVTFYQNAYTHRIGRLWQWNRWLWLTWVVLALLGSYALLQAAIDNYVLIEKEQRLVVKKQQFTQDRQRLQSVINLQYDAEDMKATVEFFDRLKRVKQHGSVGRELALLSQVLSRHPAIELTQISWRRHPTLDSERVLVTLSGYVKGGQRYETLLKKADAFKRGMQKDERIDELKYINEPLNRNAAQVLSVEGRLEQKPQRLPFSLTYRLKVFEPLVSVNPEKAS